MEIPADLGKPGIDYEALRKEHWAFQPLREAKPPEVKDSSWVKDDIDRFVRCGRNEGAADELAEGREGRGGSAFGPADGKQGLLCGCHGLPGVLSVGWLV